jgi:hypothetical protein
LNLNGGAEYVAELRDPGDFVDETTDSGTEEKAEESEGMMTRPMLEGCIDAEGSSPLGVRSLSTNVLSAYLTSNVKLTLNSRGLVIDVGASQAAPNVWFAVRMVLRFSAL